MDQDATRVFRHEIDKKVALEIISLILLKGSSLCQKHDKDMILLTARGNCLNLNFPAEKEYGVGLRKNFKKIMAMIRSVG